MATTNRHTAAPGEVQALVLQVFRETPGPLKGPEVYRRLRRLGYRKSVHHVQVCLCSLAKRGVLSTDPRHPNGYALAAGKPEPPAADPGREDRIRRLCERAARGLDLFPPGSPAAGQKGGEAWCA